MSLSIEQFRGLSPDERGRRYSELSPHDKFIARMEDWGASDTPVCSLEEFLKNPPKGWEFLTAEMLQEMFPEKDKSDDR